MATNPKKDEKNLARPETTKLLAAILATALNPGTPWRD
ncbi:MAG: hypothetical protein UV95_C0004G0032 [Candidatus Falkowbacteria bacterium GW2011_GWF2_43_32]|jgi:hypothetical protein|nr:MAG: hypothetical protein UV95_C0004G0032 [Candidatus Falkowbacteria bacterium GW2011_GWF2_43_32]